MPLHLTLSCTITSPTLSRRKRARLNGGTISSKSLEEEVLQVIASREEEKSEEGLPGSVG